MADLSNIALIDTGEVLVQAGPFVRALSAIYVASGSSAGAPPVVTLVSPAEGSDLGPNDQIVIDVTDDVGLRRSIVAVRFASLALEEVAHNGDRFGARYAGSFTPTEGGRRLVLQRIGGWPAAPVIDVYLIDSEGAEA